MKLSEGSWEAIAPHLHVLPAIGVAQVDLGDWPSDAPWDRVDAVAWGVGDSPSGFAFYAGSGENEATVYWTLTDIWGVPERTERIRAIFSRLSDRGKRAWYRAMRHYHRTVIRDAERKHSDARHLEGVAETLFAWLTWLGAADDEVPAGFTDY